MKKSAVLISFDDTRRDAFVRGFWKGLAAPSLIYTSYEIPDQAIPTTFHPLPRRGAVSVSDWVKVGDLLRLAALKEREARMVLGG